MSETKHTPGPWRYDPEDQTIIGPDRRDVSICTIDPLDAPIKGRWQWGEITEANARLIAAAPELLAFAEWLLEAYHSDDGMPTAKEIARDARSVIVKATGSAA